MKIKSLTVAVGAIAISIMSSSALAFYGGIIDNPEVFKQFSFDKADGKRINDNGYRPKTNSNICGKASSIDSSPMFGVRDQYKDLYPIIGQMHSELSQINVIGSEPTSVINEIISSAKEQIEYGIALDKRNADMIENDMRRFPERLSQYEEMRSDSSRYTATAIENANRNAMDSIISMMGYYKSEQVSFMGSFERSVLDEWTMCRAFWYHEIESDYRLRKHIDIITGVDRVK